MIKTAILYSLLGGILCHGATLTVDGALWGLSISPITRDSASIADSLTLSEGTSELIPGGSVSAGVYAFASFGQLGVLAQSGLGLTRQVGGGSGYSATVPARASAYAEDYLYLGDLGPDRRLYVDVELDGALLVGISPNNRADLSSIGSIDLILFLGTSNMHYHQDGDGSYIEGANYVQTDVNRFRIWTTGTSTTQMLSAALIANTQCYGASSNIAAIACSAEVDYSHTFQFVGAGIADIHGTPIGSLTGLASQSGFDYISGSGSEGGDVPEPATTILTGGSIVLLCAGRRKWRRTARQ